MPRGRKYPVGAIKHRSVGIGGKRSGMFNPIVLLRQKKRHRRRYPVKSFPQDNPMDSRAARRLATSGLSGDGQKLVATFVVFPPMRPDNPDHVWITGEFDVM